MFISTDNQECQQFWSECLAVVARLCIIFSDRMIQIGNPIEFWQIVHDALGSQFSNQAIDCVIWRKYFEMNTTWKKSMSWKTVELGFWVDQWSIEFEFPEHSRKLVIESGFSQSTYSNVSQIYKLISPIFRKDFFTMSPPPNHSTWLTNDLTLELLLALMKPSDNPNWLLPFLQTGTTEKQGTVLEAFPHLRGVDRWPRGQLEYQGTKNSRSLWNGPVLPYFWAKEKELKLVSYLSWTLGLPIFVSIQVARVEKLEVLNK